MGARTVPALKFLQWFFRLVQLLSAALILGVYSYFLAALANHSIHIPNSVRAVEGIAGAAVLYAIIGLLLLCCLAGKAVPGLVAMVLDFAFIPAFIYVAVANKDGAGSCTGYLDTPFGKGKSQEVADGNGGFTALPSFHVACRLQTACLSVAIILIFFFIFSLLTEFLLIRSRRKESRFGPSPANNYTSGYASGNFFSRLFSRKKGEKGLEDEDNVLPSHTTPGQLDGAEPSRQSYVSGDPGPYQPHLNEHGQEIGYAQSFSTRREGGDDQLYMHNQDTSYAGHGAEYGKVETGYGYATDNPYSGPAPAGYSAPPQDYRYEDGIYSRP